MANIRLTVHTNRFFASVPKSPIPRWDRSVYITRSRISHFNAGVEKRHPWADAGVRHETGHTVQVSLPEYKSSKFRHELPQWKPSTTIWRAAKSYNLLEISMILALGCGGVETLSCLSPLPSPPPPPPPPPAPPPAGVWGGGGVFGG